jgi:hypothetical protein
MLKFIIGAICGYLFFGLGQYGLEKKYVEEGIAKLNGKFYGLVPMKNKIEE